MITLRDVVLRRGAKVLLDRVSTVINPGEKVGLVGRNGAGKSTLFALLSGKLHEDAGDFTVPAQWRLAEVEQSMPETSESATDFVLAGDTRLMEVREELARAEASGDGFAIAHAHTDLADAGEHDAIPRAQSLILGLGFQSSELDRPVDSFSGGWRMRLQLARALMAPSDLLLLDEPTNHLDLDALVWLEAWLKRYAGTLVVISHDREFLDAVTNVTLHIEHQKLTRYSGNYTAFELLRSEQLSLQQAAFAKQQDRIAHLQKFIDRFKAKATKAKQAQSRVKALERMEKIAPVLASAEFTFEFREPLNVPNPMLVIQDGVFGYGAPSPQPSPASGRGSNLRDLATPASGRGSNLRDLATPASGRGSNLRDLATPASGRGSNLRDLSPAADARNDLPPLPQPGEMSKSLPLPLAGEGWGEGSPTIILRSVNRSVLAGQRIGILGANGQGKSTFVKTIARTMPQVSGTITEGKGLAIGYFAQQELDVLRPQDTPLEHMVRLAREHAAALQQSHREQDLRNFLGQFLFSGDMVQQAVGTMSGGEKARLVLAMIVWQRPNLLLLDEPTNHLDLSTREALSVALNEFEGTVMLVSHDRALLRSVCDEFWLVGSGAVAPFDGDLDDYQQYLLDAAKRRAGKTSDPTPSTSASASGPAIPGARSTSTAAPAVGAKPAQGAATRPGAVPSAAPTGAKTPSSANAQAPAFRNKELEARLRPLKKELAEVEKKMAALEEEKAALESSLAEARDIAESGRRLKTVTEELAWCEHRWLTISEQIESAV